MNKSKFGPNSSIYRFATENLNFMNAFDYSNKRVLSVGGSGDQMLEAYRRGAAHVTCFDVNIQSQFFIELKMAALKTYDLKSYKTAIHSGLIHNYHELKSYLTPTAVSFFEANLKRLTFTDHTYHNIEQFIPYLENEHAYLQMQERLPTNLTWINMDLRDAANALRNTWHIVMLSNIADYSHVMFDTNEHILEFYMHCVHPFKTKINKGGILIYAYIYDSLNEMGSDKRNCFNDPD